MPVLVKDLMTPVPKTLERNDRLTIAEEVMQMERIRHLPVLDEYGRVAGLLSQRDLYFNALLRALGFGTVAKERTLAEVKVKECMTGEPITVAPSLPARDAADLLIEHRIGCLPVVEGDKLVGIVTETDFVAAYRDAADS
jgi:CBS domain-containing protein